MEQPLQNSKQLPREIVQSIVITPEPIKKPKSKIRPQEYNDCGLNPSAEELAELIATSTEQQRPIIICNSKLAILAQEKAMEMAELGEVSHKGKYSSPNIRLSSHGFILPEGEKELYNTVEAVMGGEVYADDAWLSFQSSFPHRNHLLAESKIFKAQESMGVGYFRKIQSPHVDYWVVYFANLSN